MAQVVVIGDGFFAVGGGFVAIPCVQKLNLKHLRIAAFQCWSCVHGCMANQSRRAQKTIDCHPLPLHHLLLGDALLLQLVAHPLFLC
jgi:hypothetical protein